MSDDKQILLASQKDPTEDEPLVEGIYRTGVLANVLQLLKLPDGTVKVLVEGKARVRITAFIENEAYFEASAVEIAETETDADAIKALSRTVAEEVASSWARWQSAKSTIVTAEAAVAATEQAVEGLKKEAVGGNRTLTEVLDAQNSLLTAQVTLERAHRNEFVARAGLLAAIGRLDAGAILDGRCCATGDAPRPAMSALGHPVIASNAVTGMQIAGGPLRPVQSPLGRPPAPAGIAGTDASRASGNDAVAGYLNPSRPSASLLGRKLD